MSPKPAASSSNASHWLLSSGSLALFFPEGIGAVIVWLVSPGWLFSLLGHGEFLPALALFAGVGASIGAGYFAFSRQSKGLLYVSILLALLAALWVNDLSNSA